VVVVNVVRMVHAHITVQNVIMKTHVPENKNAKMAHVLTHQKTNVVKMILVLPHNVVKMANAKIVTLTQMTHHAVVKNVLLMNVVLMTIANTVVRTNRVNV